MIYCTLLYPAIDCLYTVDAFVPGSTQTDIPCRVVPAGKGMNVAMTVRTLGEEVCVIGVLPERDRHRFVPYLENNGIQHRFLFTPGDVRMNVTVIEKNTGTTSHLNSAVPALPPRIQDEFLQFIGEHPAPGDEWCFAGGVPPGFDDDTYAKLITRCASAGAATFLDSRGKSLQLGVRARPLVIKPNSAEMEDIFGEQIKGVHHLALKGKKLLDRGVAHVFISLGSDGMIALHDSDCLLCTPPLVRAVDRIGCGDALMAGILVARKRNFSFPETCRLAVACGASKVMHEGPHSVTRDEVWQLMEEVRITAI